MTKSSKIDCLFVHVPNLSSYKKNELEYFVTCIAMGVFSMSNELKKNNFQPQIINLGVEKILDQNFSITKYIKQNKINLVGLSLHWHYQTYDTLLVAQYIKKINPDTKIFLGGITSSAFAADILSEYPEIDFIIKGEGEKPIVEIVKRISKGDYNLSKIPNVYWRGKDNKIHKNNSIWFANEEELNSFNFDGLDFLKNYQTQLILPINFKHKYNDSKNCLDYNNAKKFVGCLGRGCPGNCTWCGGGYEAIKEITGRDRITIRDPKIVAKEIIKMKRKYDIDIFYFCYDPMPNNQKFLIEIFELLGREMPKEINIFFECFGLPTKEFIDSVKKNLGEDSEIIISPELGDEKMRFMHKAFPFTDIELFGCIEYIISQDLFLKLYFASLPFESVKSIDTTLRMVKLLKERNYPKMMVLYQGINDCEPYTPWAKHPEIYGNTINLKTLNDYVQNSKRGRNFL